MEENVLTRADVSEALDELIEGCFSAIERRGLEELALPKASEFLRERGIDDSAAAVVSIRHTVEALDAEPEIWRCNGGECYPVCKVIKGEQHCVWKCYNCD